MIPVPVLFRPCPSKLSGTSIGLIVLGIVVALVLLPLGAFIFAKKVRGRGPETSINTPSGEKEVCSKVSSAPVRQGSSSEPIAELPIERKASELTTERRPSEPSSGQ